MKRSEILLFLLGLALIIYYMTTPLFSHTEQASHWLLIIGGALSAIATVFNNSFSLKWGGWVLNLVGKRIDDGFEKIYDKLKGEKYKEHSEAFDEAIELVEAIAKHETKSEIDLHLIAVSIRFSLKYITKEFEDLYKKYPNITFSWKIAYVDPEYLKQFRLDTKYNWVKGCKANLAKIKEYKTSCLPNVSIETFPYCMIPQRHGLLINRIHLFLGRTDWEFNTQSNNTQPKKPRLKVGEKSYFYHHNPTRIEEFRHWFSFYSDQAIHTK